MIRRDGLFWPDADRRAHVVMPRYLKAALPEVIRHVPWCGLAFQAGGNVGLYPIALADHFDRVVTVEPDPENFACLVANIGAKSNIEYRQCALGSAIRTAGIARQPDNCGASSLVAAGTGVEVIRIDDLALGACDLIWLSVNGCQLDVLKGAKATISAHRPVVVISEQVEGGGDDLVWLKRRGYRQAARVPIRDYIMVP